MKRMAWKTTSIVMALLMVLSVFSVMTVSATATPVSVSASGTTRIEGENYDVSTHASLEDNVAFYDTAVGIRITNVANSSSTKYTTSYPLTVAEAGYYRVVAAGSNGGYSTWGVYANTATNVADAKVSQNASFRIGNWGATAGDVYDCGVLYLQAGENTLYWYYSKTNANKLTAALDYIELTPTAATDIASSGTTRVEAETIYASTYTSFVPFGALDTGHYGVKMNLAETSSTQYTISYKVNVAEAGSYGLTVAASKRQMSTLVDWTVYANDTSNAGSDYTAQGTTFNFWGIGGNPCDVHDCGKIHLNAGENTIYFKFGKKDNAIRFALDYFELTAPETVTVNAAGTTRIEGEEAFNVEGGGYSRRFNDPDDGLRALAFTPNPPFSGEYKSTYLVNVSAAGYYRVHAVATVRSQTYTTDWRLYANGNEAPMYQQGADVTTNYWMKPNNFKHFDCGWLYLNEGTNRITWEINSADPHENGTLQAGLDYIELTPQLYVTDAAVSNGTFTANINKSGPLSYATKAFVAVYEDSTCDVMNEVSITDIAQAAGTQSISVPVTVDSGNLVKLFVWYLNNIEPLCEAISVSN